MTNETSGISRRTLAKGAAWAVPAVAVAAATPAMAASPGTITFTNENCKLPGNSVYPYKNGAVYLMAVSNTTAVQIKIDIESVSRGNETQSATDVSVVKLTGSSDCCTKLDSTFYVAANSSDTYALVTKEWSNSANNNLTAQYEVDDVQQPAATGVVNNLNPFGAQGQDCGSTTGSCTAIAEAYKLCILAAIEVPGCVVTSCVS